VLTGCLYVTLLIMIVTVCVRERVDGFHVAVVTSVEIVRDLRVGRYVLAV
jgi:hypothetical protein